MIRHLTVAAAAVAVLLVAPTASSVAAARPPHRPATIALPALFQPEGVATDRHGNFYAGSRADGRIARGSLRGGTSEVFVDSDHALTTAATGLKADERHRLLWVAGAGTGMAAVYDLATGAGVVALTLATPPPSATAPSFVNDVVVTRDAVYFTDSQRPVIYRVPVSKDGRVGQPETISVSGAAKEDFVVGATNLNGIDATRDGGTLVAVNSTQGTLYAIDPHTGDSAPIDLGEASVPTGDGILLLGRQLLVLQNGGGDPSLNQIAVVRLNPSLTRGTIVRTRRSPLFETATTLARSGATLVAVNAQFGAPASNPAELVLLPPRG